MSASRPSPECMKDRVVYLDKGLLAADRAVIVCSSPNDRVKHPNQITRFGLRMAFDDLSDFSQERFLVPGRRLDDKLAIIVPAYMLPEKVKTGFNRRDPGFLWREFQTAFL